MHSALEIALLELGLEDVIPLGEAMSSPDIQAAASLSDPDQSLDRALAAALGRLVEQKLVVISRGKASGRSTAAARAGVAGLLSDPWWFGWGRESIEERVFFVNVRNIPSDQIPAWLE